MQRKLFTQCSVKERTGIVLEKYTVSVRNLVEFLLREGNIDNRHSDRAEKDAMLAGTRIHRKIQQRMKSKMNYQSEVALSYVYQEGTFFIETEGRADGIFEQDGITYIDEIKGVYRDVSEIEQPEGVHKAQAMCYAFFYSKLEQLQTIGVQMTYVNLETEQIRYFKEEFSAQEMEEWFMKLMKEYEQWIRFSYEHKVKRNESCNEISFPYQYRKGQKAMVATVYRQMEQGGRLFVQAPTGIGKTMATIFPSIKSIGQNRGDKLFYLTAKTITRTVAVDTFRLLRKQGLYFSSLVITAKEKICMMEECVCNPDNCSYAEGHYDRINEAVFDLITHEEEVTREIIEAYAIKHRVCPFEFSLDVSLWVDGIICDYNYVFDPRVNLKRYFAQGVKGDYLFLVDEAHNLYDRAKTMYSATIQKESFLICKQIVKEYDNKLYKALDQCNKELLRLKKLTDGITMLESVDTLLMKLLRVNTAFEEFWERHIHLEEEETLLELYFQVMQFLAIAERLDDSYVIYSECKSAASFEVNLYCVHTANNLKECFQKARASVLFSATLLPIMYYKDLLGDQEDPAIYLESPFAKERRRILIDREVTTKYTSRNEKQYERIAEHIYQICQAHQGNYMIFFPSYKMLSDVGSILSGMDGIEGWRQIAQMPDMKEEERDRFLQAFETEEKPVLALCIMGGIFSEGIDLVKEKLIGAVLVGTGLPMVCTERNILRDYFEERNQKGFEYAYLYPGMNKVQQAAGRVIRTEEDYGVIALLDERFAMRQYVELFPAEWDDYELVNRENISQILQNFWSQIPS